MGTPSAPQPPAEELDWHDVLSWLPLLADDDFDPGPGPHVVEDDGGVRSIRSGTTESVGALVRALYRAGVVGGFDWPTWIRNDGRRFSQDPSVLASASLEDCRRLLAAHVRADRFTEGHLVEALRSGQVLAILRRIDELVVDT